MDDESPLLVAAATAALVVTSGPSPTVTILSTTSPPNGIHTVDSIYDTIHELPLSSSSSSSSVTTSTSFPLMALLISTSVVGSIMVFTLPFIVMPFLSGQSLPYMATPKKKIQKALQFIQQQRRGTSSSDERRYLIQGKRTRQFLDLGSGDGETVYQAVQLLNSKSTDQNTHNHHSEKFYYTKCVGIELNTTLYLWSYWRRMMFWTRSEQLRSQFLCRNMFQLNNHTTNNTNKNNPPQLQWIRQSDTIMIFGIPSLMVPLSQLLAQHQCQSGTYVLCYRFPLPTMNIGNRHKNKNIQDSKESVDTTLLSAQLIYDQEEMRIYECTGPITVNDSINDRK